MHRGKPMTPTCSDKPTLNQADINAIAQAVNAQRKCSQFTPEEVTFVRDLIGLLKETRSLAVKIMISAFVAFLLGALAIGVKASLRQ